MNPFVQNSAVCYGMPMKAIRLYNERSYSESEQILSNASATVLVKMTLF